MNQPLNTRNDVITALQAHARGEGPALETRSRHGGQWTTMRYHEEDGPQFQTDHDTWANDSISNEDDYRFVKAIPEPGIPEGVFFIKRALQKNPSSAQSWHRSLAKACRDANGDPDKTARKILQRLFGVSVEMPPRVKVSMEIQDLIDALAPDYEACTKDEATYRTDPERMCGLYKSSDGSGWMLGTDLAGDVSGTEYIFLRKKV